MITVTIPHGVSAGLDDSKEKTSVIPVETPEIDTGQPAEAVNDGAVAAGDPAASGGARLRRLFGKNSRSLWAE
jgi:hypothetical protein